MAMIRAPKREILLLEKDGSIASSLLGETIGVGLEVTHFEVLREMLGHMESSEAGAIVLGPSCKVDELEQVENHREVLRNKVPILTFLAVEEESTARVSLPSPLPSGALKKHLMSLCHLHEEVLILRHELESFREQEREFYELGSVISHDLRSPLGIVLGYAGLLLNQSELPELERSHVKCIDEASNKMLSLINALEKLNSLRNEELELTLCGEDLLNEALEELREERMTLRCDLKVGEWVPFEGDKKMVLFLLKELLQNAKVHNPPGTEIRVDCQLIDERRQTVVEMAKPLVVLKVRDLGEGIGAEHLKSVFRPFFRLNPKSPGHGLGLGLAKGILERHGGTLSLHGNDEGGVTVFATFPKNQKDRLSPRE